MKTYSIVIPIYGYKDKISNILNLLLSIINSNTDYLNEVVVVNNGGQFDSVIEGHLKQIADLSGIKIFIVNTDLSGLNNARNIGVQKSTGEVIIYLDDDVFFLEDSVGKLVSVFDDEQVKVVSGQIKPIFDRTVPNWMSKEYFLRFLVPTHYPEHFSQIVFPYFVFGGCMAISRDVFEKFSFDPFLDRNKNNLLSGGDIEVSLAVREKEAFINPDAVFYTIVKVERFTIKFFIRRFYWQGVTDYMLLKKFPGRLYDNDELKFNIKGFTYTFKIAGFYGILCYFARIIGYKLKKNYG